MELLRLLSFIALALASAAVGTRLLLLAARTRELPELVVGLSFLFTGLLASSFFFVHQIFLEARGPDALATRGIGLLGFLASWAGAASSAVGNWRIFRPGRRWALGLVVVLIGLPMVLAVPTVGAQERQLLRFFGGALLCFSAVRLWTATECWMLAATLHRRARLGLADPVVLNRAFFWGGAAALASLLITIPACFGIAMAAAPPQGWRATISLIGLVVAALDWLAFFPPRALKRRLLAAYGAA